MTEKMRQSQQASATLRDIFVKDHSWCCKIKFFPRSFIYYLLYFCDFSVSDSAYVGSFGYVLPD